MHKNKHEKVQYIIIVLITFYVKTRYTIFKSTRFEF